MNNIDYDEVLDIYFQHFGKGKTKHSRELTNVDIIIDFDKEDNIVGIEIYNFMKAIKESDKKLDEIFAKAKKIKKEKKK